MHSPSPPRIITIQQMDLANQALVSSSEKWVHKYLRHRVMRFYEPYLVSSRRIVLLRKQWEFAERTGMLERRSKQREGLVQRQSRGTLYK